MHNSKFNRSKTCRLMEYFVASATVRTAVIERIAAGVAGKIDDNKIVGDLHCLCVS